MGTFTLDKTANFVLIAVLILMPVVSHAGGLGVAPLIFVLGIIGLILYCRTGERKLRQSGVFLTLTVFLVWLCITAFWSPYRPDDILTNYIKLLIMGLTFYFCPGTFKYVAKTKSKTLQRIFLITTYLSAIIIFLDVVTNFQITLFFNPASTSTELGYRIRDAEMNLGHGLTVLVLLSVPMVLPYASLPHTPFTSSMVGSAASVAFPGICSMASTAELSSVVDEIAFNSFSNQYFHLCRTLLVPRQLARRAPGVGLATRPLSFHVQGLDVLVELSCGVQ